MRAIALILLFAFGCAAPIQAQTTEVEVIGDPAIYGTYPKDYQAIVTKWLEMKLVDPASAVVEWTSPPKPAELPGLKGQKLHGYLVEFTVKARNRFGAYTGKQKHGALIRDGVVIKGTGFGF